MPLPARRSARRESARRHRRARRRDPASQPRQSTVRRGVEVHEHAHHRAPLTLAAVLAARRRLPTSRFLQDDPRPRVREPQPVLLGGPLPEVLDREVRVPLPPQATQLADRFDRDALATNRARPLSIAQLSETLPLHRSAYPPHVPCAHVQDLRRLQPRDLPVDRLHHHLPLRHVLHLPGHQPPNVVHGARR